MWHSVSTTWLNTCDVNNGDKDNNGYRNTEEGPIPESWGWGKVPRKPFTQSRAEPRSHQWVSFLHLCFGQRVKYEMRPQGRVTNPPPPRCKDAFARPYLQMYQQWKTHVPPSDQPWEQCQRFPVMKGTKNTFWWWRKWKLSNADWVEYGNDTKWHPGNKASSPPGLRSLNLDLRLRTRRFVPGGHAASLCLHAPSNILEREKNVVNHD